jgi:hypothetical protein
LIALEDGREIALGNVLNEMRSLSSADFRAVGLELAATFIADPELSLIEA